MIRRCGILAQLALAALVVACADQEQLEARGDSGARADAMPPPEAFTVRLTLTPVFGFSDRYEGDPADGGNSSPTFLGGARVCIEYRGPYGAKWADFSKIDPPLCVRSELGQKVVFDDAPGHSELIVTVEADGYQPSVIAVTTTSGDTDTTGNRFLQGALLLRALDSAPPWVPSTISYQPDLGQLEFGVVAISANYSWNSLEGVTVALVDDDGNPVGVGPLFLRQGVHVASAEVTVGAGGRFVNVPDDGVYRLTLRHPRATCRTSGYIFGDAVSGYAGLPNEVRAPVLRGHLSPSVTAHCVCTGELSAPGTADMSFLATCGADGDGGAP